MKKILLLLLICFAGSLYAQQKEFVFTKIGKEFGLASPKINCIVKDRQGYYWVASDYGLQRYDGHSMINFRHHPADIHSLPDNKVTSLLVDKQNRLWLISGAKPCLYEPLHRRFIQVSAEIKDESIRALSFYMDSKGIIWMRTSGNDMHVLDTINNIFRKYTSVWPAFTSKIHHLVEDTANNYYWLSTTTGIAIYDVKKRNYYSYQNNPLKLPLLSNPVFSGNPPAFYKDHNNIIWLQTWEPPNGFIHYRYDIKKKELNKIGINVPRAWGWLTDASGTTWTYGITLAMYHEKMKKYVNVPPQRNSLYGIDYNDIAYLTQDAEGNIWLASNLGLYYFNPQKQYFSTVTSVFEHNTPGITDANINSFIETSDGHIIAMRWGGTALHFFDKDFNSLPPLYGNRPEQIKDGNYMLAWCGLQDNKGLIWIGCQHGHIIQIDPSRHQTNFLFPPEFENKTIRSIAEDKNGNIWFGTQNNVIVKWERATNRFKQIIPLSKEKYWLEWVLHLLPGNGNDMWVASTSGGLLHIDCDKNEVIEQFLPDAKNSSAISSGDVKDLLRLNTDTLVLATGKGLDIFDINRKTFSHITEADGLPAEGIISMIKDERNNIWYSSINGISRINIYNKRVKNFGAADGVTEQDFQFGSVARFKNGTVAFGNTRGMVLFNPSQINDAGTPSDVSITDFRVFNKRLSVDSLLQNGNAIHLKNSQNSFVIQFASLGNIMYNRPSYYYKLDGVDKDWKASSNQEAVYTYLPGGRYTFKVKSVSPDGIESKNINSFTIYIARPFYLQWWFIVLALGIIGSVTYYIYLLRIRRRNEREFIRNRIARDLHDDMGSTLSTINILSSMAKSKLKTDEVKASEYINKISDNSQRMMEAMDDIVWAIKPDNDSMQRIVARMREFATNVLESKDIEPVFHVAGNVNEVKLDMEQRRDFFLVFKEAVNNVAKYSKCKKATIQIGELKSRLVLMVKDDGVGFDVKTADGGNGLGNMQKRADALKGRLQIHSKPGEGTQVTLNIPVS